MMSFNLVCMLSTRVVSPFVLLSIVFLTQAICLPGFAQFNKLPPGMKSSPSRYSRSDREIQLPFLPKYPGRSVFRGVTTVEVQGQTGHGYALVYDVADDRKKVSDWYKSALAQSGWKLRPASEKTGNEIIHHENLTVEARRPEGIRCTIIPAKPMRQGYKTFLSIRYANFPPPAGMKKTDHP